MINKTLSAIVAITYLFIAYSHWGPAAAIRCVGFLLLPLACIWFSREMGSYTGTMFRRNVSAESPGCFIIACGWLLLLLPVIVALLWRLQGNSSFP